MEQEYAPMVTFYRAIPQAEVTITNLMVGCVVMRLLPRLIRLYRRYLLVRIIIRLLIRIHHRAVAADRSPCTLADCSGTGLAEATAIGWKALPGICSRISACGLPASPGQFCFDMTDPCTRL